MRSKLGPLKEGLIEKIGPVDQIERHAHSFPLSSPSRNPASLSSLTGKKNRVPFRNFVCENLVDDHVKYGMSTKTTSSFEKKNKKRKTPMLYCCETYMYLSMIWDRIDSSNCKYQRNKLIVFFRKL